MRLSGKSRIVGSILGGATVGVVLLSLGLGCAERSRQVFPEEKAGAREANCEGVDPMLLDKVRPL